MITNLNHAEIGGTRKIVPWKIAPPGDCLNPNPNPKPNPNPGRKMLGAIFREATFLGGNFQVTGIGTLLQTVLSTISNLSNTKQLILLFSLTPVVKEVLFR